MKKRFLLLICIIVLSLSAICLFSSCSLTGDGETVDQNTCSHDFGGWKTTLEATCEVRGTKERTCSICDLVQTVKYGGGGHKGGEATCSSLAKCTACGSEYGNYTEHSYSVKNTDTLYRISKATCTSPAVYYYSCSCGEKGTTTFTHGVSLEHEYVSKANGDGTHTLVCKNDSNHTKTEVCYGGTATCIDKAVCSVCSSEYGNPAGHSWKLSPVGTGASQSCELGSTAHYGCENCEATKTEIIPPKGHTYNSVVTLPTCTNKGYTTHTCKDCGYSYQDTEVPATGIHNWDYETCTCEHGRTCTDCNTSEPALPHQYKITAHKAATCEEEAKDTYTCIYGCTGEDSSYEKVSGPALGHDVNGVKPVEKLVEGTTCTYIQEYKCKACGEGVIATEAVTDAEGNPVFDENDQPVTEYIYVYHHSYTAKVTKEANCTEAGVKTYTCVCGDSYTEEIPVNPDSHVWNDGVVEGSVKTYTCTVEGCSATKTAVVASTDNKADNLTSDVLDSEVEFKDATLDVSGLTGTGGTLENADDVSLSAGKLDGDAADAIKDSLTEAEKAQIGDKPIYEFTMSVGGQNISSLGGMVTVTIPYTPAEGEDVDSIAIWFIGTDGTLEVIEATYANGYVTFETDHFSTYSVTSLTPEERCELYGHNYTSRVIKGTCTKQGYTLYVCKRCSDTYKDTYTDPIGHNYTEKVTPPTCTKAGKIVYTCQNQGCRNKYEEKTPATGHIYEITTQDPTCTEAGYEKGKCKCGDSYVYVIPVLRHDVTFTVVDPTCELEGYTLYECKNCDYEYKDNFTAAEGHSPVVAWTWADDHSTATAVVTCSLGCEFSYTETVTAVKKTTAATCTQAGRVDFTAKLVYNGETFSNVYSEITDLAEHVYGDNYRYDAQGHALVCVNCAATGETVAHAWGEGKVTKLATCKNEGEKTYVCVCGAVKTESIPKTEDHKYTANVCTVCGDTRECTHSYDAGKETTAPTCITEGVKTYTCTICQHTKTEAIAKSDIHDYNVETVEPGCITAGIKTYTCKLCSKTKTELIPSAGAHKFEIDVDATVPATCVSEGYMTTVCTVCGETETDTLPKTEHAYDNGVVTKPACFETEGIITYTCTVCNRTKAEKLPAAEAHDFDDGVVTTAPSCGVEGVMTYTCKVCAKTETEAIPAIEDHEYGEAVVIVKPGCLTTGTQVSICIHCGDKNIETIESLGGHKETEEITTKATCTEDGLKTFTCENCKVTRTEIIKKTGHVFENGKCTGCGMETGCETHDFGAYKTIVRANCAFEGERVRTCKTCGFEEIEIIPKTDKHTYNGGVVVTPPACEIDGIKVRTCGRCGHTQTENLGNLGGHNWDKGVVTTEPGCVTEGVLTYTCHRGGCGATKTETIPSLGGHKFDSGVVTTEPTCAQMGVITYTCTVCGGTEVEYLPKTNDHVYDNSCDADCNVCGEKREVVHTYDNACDAICNVCGAERVVADHVYDNACDATCNECGAERTVADHVYDNACDATCNECGAERTVADHVYEGVVTKAPTCIEKGVKTFTCTACGDSYTEELDTVDHVYVDGVCTVCKSDNSCTHEFGEPEVVKEATCAEEGVLLYVCTVCGGKKNETLPKTENHVWDNDCDTECNVCATVRETQHVYDNACDTDCNVCGEERKITHNYEGVVTTEPTCKDEGVKTFTCTVCGDSYTEKIDTVAHTYVDGVCTVCGEKEGECDHTEFTEKTIDLKELGACGGILTYKVCECGEVAVIDESFIENFEDYCDFDDAKMDNGEYEDGTMWMTMEGKCADCGFAININATARIEGCYIYADYVFNIYFGETELLVGAIYQMVEEDHDEEYTTLDLKEYGACGGTVEVRQCVVCGKVTEMDEPELVCNDGKLETSQGVGEDGVPYMRITSECEKCGLVLFAEARMITVSPCEERMEITYKLSVGDTVIVDCYNEEHHSSHNYEYSYELHGKTCEDGYTVTETCTKCGDTYTYDADWHKTDRFYVELSEYGLCGGFIEGEQCVICNNVTNVWGFRPECQLEEIKKDKYTDENGVAHTTFEHICVQCNTVFSTDSYTLGANGCETKNIVNYVLSRDGKTLYEFAQTQITTNHVFEEEIIVTPTCKNEGEAVYTCTACGMSYSMWLPANPNAHTYDEGVVTTEPTCKNTGVMTYTCTLCEKAKTETVDKLEHTYVDGVCTGCGRIEGSCDHTEFTEKTIDLKELGACGGTIIYQTCECGEVIKLDEEFMDDFEPDCDNLEYEEGEPVFNEDGSATASMSTYCLDCGFRVNMVMTAKQDGCSVYYSYVIDFLIGETEIITGAVGEMSYDDHNTERREINLKEYGACGGVIVVYQCMDCGEITEISDCEFVCNGGKMDLIQGEDYSSASLYCEKCGLDFVAEMKTDYVSECERIEYIAYRLTVGGKEIVNAEDERHYSNHEYLYTYELLGKTCDDGYICRAVCNKCQDSYEYEGKGHRTEHFYEELSKYGICGGFVEGEKCNICNTAVNIWGFGTKCEYNEPEKKEYTDELGNLHSLMTSICVKCNTALVEDIYTVSNGCETRYVTDRIIYVEGNVAYSISEVRYETNHSYTVEIIVAPTCKNPGEALYTCEKCGNSYTSWLSPSMNAHVYDEGVVTTEPTCKKTGVITYTCTLCGKTKTGTLDKLSHNYVDGVCTGCGHVEGSCDHTEFTDKTIDLKELGACGGILTYKTCECGEVTVVDESFIENFEDYCNFDDAKMDDGEYEDGTMWMTMEAKCADCGFAININATARIEGCYIYANYVFDIYFGETELLVGAIYEMVEEDHDEEYTTLDLKEYGACGGTVEVRQCVVCGKVTEMGEPKLVCNDGKLNMSSGTDENGVPYQRITSECEKCGLVLFAEARMVTVSPCEERMEITYKLSVGDTVIIDCYNEERDSSHNYEYTYELNGKTCEEGYTVIETCNKCGRSYSYNGQGHRSEHFHEELSVYGICGGYAEGYKCRICNTVTELYNVKIACKGENHEKDQFTDENGVIHTVSTYTCVNCGHKIINDNYTVVEGCHTKHVTSYEIYSGETLVYQVQRVGNSYSHVYEYTYQFDGEIDCDQGVRVIATCTLCGETDEYHFMHHAYDYGTHAEYNLAELGACGGYINVYSCPCGEYNRIERNIYCGYSEKYDSYVDANGIEHNVTTCDCNKCGLVFTYDRYYAVEGCYRIYYVDYSLSIDGKEIFSGFTTEDGRQEYHDYEITYEMNGESCTDGVRVMGVCKACGNKQSEYIEEHYPIVQNIYTFADKGACESHYFALATCACGEEYEYETDAKSLTYDEKLGAYVCECGYTVTIVEQTVTDGCNKNITVRLAVAVGDYSEVLYENVVSTVKHSFTVQSVDADRNATLVCSGCGIAYGEVADCRHLSSTKSQGYLPEGVTNCDQGYYVVEFCPDCGHVFNVYTEYYHSGHTTVENRFDSYGACEHHYFNLYSCACGQNSGWNSDMHGLPMENGSYICKACGLSYKDATRSYTEACVKYNVHTITAKIGDTEIVLYTQINSETSHNYEYKAVIGENGELSFVGTCVGGCGNVLTKETTTVTLTENEGQYYYDFEITPDNDGYYFVTSIGNHDTCVSLYEVVDGELVYLSSNSGHYNWNFGIGTHLVAGTTYVYRMGMEGFSQSGDITFLVFGGSSCSHNEKNFAFFKDGADDCDEGYYSGYYCILCGELTSIYETSGHSTFQKDYIDLDEYDICRDHYIGINECLCGERHSYGFDSYRMSYDSATETYSCYYCDYKLRIFTEYVFEGCVRFERYIAQITVGDATENAYVFESSKVVHSYETVVTESENGILTVKNVCSVCGDSYVMTEEKGTVSDTDYGTFYEIVVEAEVGDVYRLFDVNRIAYFELVRLQDDGYYHLNSNHYYMSWTCSEAGTYAFRLYPNNGRDSLNYIFVKDEGTCNHTNKQVALLAEKAESCADGVYRGYICESCGVFTEFGKYYEHNTVTGEEIRFDSYGACKSHYVRIDKCACGEVKNYYSNYHNLPWDSERELYYCNSCEFTYKAGNETITDGCATHNVQFVDVTSGEYSERIYEKINTTVNHTFESTARVITKGGYEVTSVCSSCGETKVYTEDVKTAVLEEHEDGYWYDVTVTPEKTGKYLIFSVDKGTYSDTYVELYRVVGDELEYIVGESYGADNGHFRMERRLLAGETYVYRIRFNYVWQSGNIDYVLKAPAATKCNHYETEHFTQFRTDVEDCEAGFISYYVCKGCGDVTSITTRYYHDNQYSEHYNFTEYGACSYHYVNVYTCLCGEEKYFDYDGHNLTRDEETGICSCATCGYTFNNVTEDVVDGCTTAHVNYVDVAIGEYSARLFEKTTYTVKHSYEVSVKALENGAYETTSICSVCGDRKVYTEDIKNADLVEHEDGYWYDLTVTPESSKYYVFYCKNENRSTYVELYRVEGDNLVRLSQTSESGQLQYRLYAGESYIYRIRYSDINESGSIKYVLNILDVNCNHNETARFFDFKTEVENCVAGVFSGYICVSCGDIRSITLSNSHQTHTQEYFDLDGYENICQSHYIYAYACDCGASYHYDYDWRFSYDSETQSYKCATCEFSFKELTEYTYEGCIKYQHNSIEITYGDLTEKLYENVSAKVVHTYVSEVTQNEDGSLTVKSVCSVCGDTNVYVEEYETAVLENHDGEYWYDLTVTPEKSGRYTIYSVVKTGYDDTYVELFRLDGEELVYLVGTDGGGFGGNFRLDYILNEGETYVYRIRYWSISNSANIPYVFSEAAATSSCTHEETVRFTDYATDEENCNAGIYVGLICVSCGDVTSINLQTTHSNQQKEYFDLDNYEGICKNHYIYANECDCGASHSYDLATHYLSYNSTTQSYYCRSCEYSVRIFTEYTYEGCIRYEHYSVEITIGETSEVIYSFETPKTVHTYESVVTKAENGTYTVTSTCSVCGDVKVYTEDAETAVLENHDGEYWYDLTVTPEKSGRYVIYSVVRSGNTDTYVELFRLDGEELVSLSGADGGGFDGNFRLEYNLTAGSTYVYRIRYWDISNSSNINYVFELATNTTVCDHGDKVNFMQFATEVKDCSAGIYNGYVCASCGFVTSITLTTAHQTVKTETYNLADYGACGGGTVTISECMCGYSRSLTNNYRCPAQYQGEVSETDENGVTHRIRTYVCECGFTYVRDRYTAPELEGCYEMTYYEWTFKVGETEIISGYKSIYSRNDRHQYDYEFELLGETCSDGYNVTSTCVNCGLVSTSRSSGCSTYLIEKIRFDDYVQDTTKCGGYVEYYSCPCGNYNHYNVSIRCSYNHTSESVRDENGVLHSVSTYTCVSCGMVFTRDEYTVREGCFNVTYTTLDLVYGEKVILSDYSFVSSRRVDHIYDYEFTLNGESCTDGYTAIGTCVDCGDTVERSGSYHETYRVEKYDLRELGACGGYVEMYSCACGQDTRVSDSYECVTAYYSDSYTDDNGVQRQREIHTCATCGLKKIIENYSETDGCYRYWYTDYTISVGDKVIVPTYTYRYSTDTLHEYLYTFELDGEVCADGYTVYGECMMCGETTESHGSYRYHSTYPIDKIYLENEGACGGYFVINECPCGEKSSVSYNLGCSYTTENKTETDEDGIVHNYYYWRCAECKLEMVRDIYTVWEDCQNVTYYYYSITVDFVPVLDEYTYVYSTSTAHELERFIELKGESCEDGYTETQACKHCDYSTERSYASHNYYANEYDLSEYGVCGSSYVTLYECPCGLNRYINYSLCSGYKYKSDSYKDDNGNIVYTEARWCNTCGLRVQHDYYTVRDVENCMSYTYHTYNVTVGDVAIDVVEYADSSTEHTYEVTAELKAGSTTCKDGVILTYNCTVCDDGDYTTSTNSHYTYAKATYEIDSVCGGYVVHNACPCGYSNSVTINGICTFGISSYEAWLPEGSYIPNGTYTVHGNEYSYSSYNISNNFYTYTCAVTDPEQCAYKYRYAAYWVLEDGCQAVRYIRYEFGYDEKTGESDFVIAYKDNNASVKTHHTYVATEISETTEDGLTVTGTQYTCSVCGTYYYNKYYRNANGHTMKQEYRFDNKLSDNYNKLISRIYEYSYYDEADISRGTYQSACHTMTVSQNGYVNEYSDYWKYDYSYVAPYGTDSYIYIHWTVNNGVMTRYEETGYAYVENFGTEAVYEFVKNNVGTSSESWHRYDYTYTIEGGCARNTVYTNSAGVTKETTEEWHAGRRYELVKAPTCTQPGIYRHVCTRCNATTTEGVEPARRHYWVRDYQNGGYYCSYCNLKNANGVNGDVVMEDLTSAYGEGKLFVVGYILAADYQFDIRVSLILADGTPVVLPEDAFEFVTLEGLTAVAVSISDVIAAATELGYEMGSYDVRISFVPEGSDEINDYAITFESPVIDESDLGGDNAADGEDDAADMGDVDLLPPSIIGGSDNNYANAF